MSDHVIPEFGTISIQVQATRELDNDILVIHFAGAETSKTAIDVQQALVTRLNAAMAIIKPNLKTNGEVEAETRSISVQPVYDRKGTITGYSGTVGVTVKGTNTHYDLAACNRGYHAHDQRYL